MARQLWVLAIAAAGCRIGFDPLAAPADAPADAVDAPPDADVRNNIVFITSTSHDLCTLTPDQADAVCAARATEAGLFGTFRAWVSTLGVNARDRLAGANGWVRPDGLPFAATITEALTISALYPARLDEHGADPAVYPVTVTGTDFLGRDAGGCLYGGRPSSSREWGSGLIVPGGRLQCFGVDFDRPLPVRIAAAGRIAFLSSGSFTPSSGIAAADALCTSDAAGAGLAGTFRAFLPTTTISAAARFNLTGAPWVRTDGLAVVNVATDIESWKLVAPIDRTANGTFSYALVWTGSAITNPSLASTCTDWSSGSGMGNVSSDAESHSTQYGAAVMQACTTAAFVYCLQL